MPDCSINKTTTTPSVIWHHLIPSLFFMLNSLMLFLSREFLFFLKFTSALCLSHLPTGVDPYYMEGRFVPREGSGEWQALFWDVYFWEANSQLQRERERAPTPASRKYQMGLNVWTVLTFRLGVVGRWGRRKKTARRMHAKFLDQEPEAYPPLVSKDLTQVCEIKVKNSLGMLHLSESCVLKRCDS